MQMKNTLRLALEQLKANKLRTFLTLIGIIIGVGSVVAILLIGESGRKDIIGEFEKDANKLFYLHLDTSDQSKTNQASLGWRDIDLLRDQYQRQAQIAASYLDQKEAVFEQDTEQVDITAVTDNYSQVSNMINIAYGSFWNEGTNQNVVLINEALAEKHYGTASQAIGHSIMIDRVPFTIQAVYTTNDFVQNGSQANLYVPLQSWYKIHYLTDRPVHSVEVLVLSENSFDQLRTEMVRTLAESKGVAETSFRTQAVDDQLDMVNNILRIFTAIISSVAGISLLVGGIGVMNIMLVSVMERTREIGIRKAIGAKPRHILQQFLIETLVLTTLGGFIGCLFGLGMALLVTQLAEMSFVFYWPVFLISFGITTIIGILSGFYPARKAARLDPIVSLRYE
ncbi:FtsX-like permease family protein [Gracilibacillus salitolerans]|uniref:FtsX-like permease family protein n=1 Tax=Gracilibacillus salitolerans TaxID=2663022 RepID=A0A5Q2TF25_9BACI|nr:ABC transporter permease [Gracilibacillus salitolerans]QGH33275.1 FtsX-like permease family protein [Gracilibacillus salitolerans]